MADPLRAIAELLASEHGVPHAKLKPGARLYHDLGLDGDDADELFRSLNERFGTDFSALDRQWTEYFNSEGMSLRCNVIAFAAVVPPVALALLIATSLRLPLGGFLALVMAGSAAAFFVAIRAYPAKTKRPITLATLADVVRTGSWPAAPREPDSPRNSN